MSRWYGFQIMLDDADEVDWSGLRTIMAVAEEHWPFEGWTGVLPRERDLAGPCSSHAEGCLVDAEPPEDRIAKMAESIRVAAGFDFKFRVIITYIEQTPSETVNIDDGYYALLEERP